MPDPKSDCPRVAVDLDLLLPCWSASGDLPEKLPRLSILLKKFLATLDLFSSIVLYSHCRRGHDDLQRLRLWLERQVDEECQVLFRLAQETPFMPAVVPPCSYILSPSAIATDSSWLSLCRAIYFVQYLEDFRRGKSRDPYRLMISPEQLLESQAEGAQEIKQGPEAEKELAASTAKVLRHPPGSPLDAMLVPVPLVVFRHWQSLLKLQPASVWNDLSVDPVLVLFAKEVLEIDRASVSSEQDNEPTKEA